MLEKEEAVRLNERRKEKGLERKHKKKTEGVGGIIIKILEGDIHKPLAAGCLITRTLTHES